MMEINVTPEAFRWLLVYLLSQLVLLVGMWVYVVRTSRHAFLGSKWIAAAGTYARAARELGRFELATEAMAIRHGSRFPDGKPVHINRAEIEQLIHEADLRDVENRGGGPGL